jgi:hypothetical protein
MIKEAEKSVSDEIKNESLSVDNLIREYKRNRWAENSKRIGKPDSLSVWVSISDMENFLSIAKSHGGDGIKFYYACYPSHDAPTPEYCDRQTLVTVATRSKKLSDGRISNKDIYVEKNGKTEILNGLISPIGCPPNCNSHEGGTGSLGITIIDKGSGGMEII